ncbi:MAG: hypothetical protein PF589_10020 [Gammaproteobacteria bacterium]|jgi:hypothetical protein|nr:hypothetical protein [Gammaproteobacteria bacterium]
MTTPDKREQILQTHAGLILAVIQSIHNHTLRPQLEHVLKQSEQNGWGTLVAVIRKIVEGNRDSRLLEGLDDEDQIIADSILQGLQDPSTLPDPEQKADAAKAAPMLAQLINDARRGDHDAVIMLGGLAEQMSAAGGDLANLGATVKSMIDGERSIDKLCSHMGPQGESLITAIITELNHLDTH